MTTPGAALGEDLVERLTAKAGLTFAVKNNIDVRGVGWGAYAMVRPGYMQQQWAALRRMLEDGTIAPPVAATYAFEEFGLALSDLEARRVLGKAVVRVRD